LSDAREYKPGTEPDWRRHDEASLNKLHEYEVPADRAADAGERLKRFRERMEFVPALNQFLVDEGVLAAVSISSRDNGIIGVSGGGSRKAGESAGVPELAMMAEHYNQIM